MEDQNLEQDQVQGSEQSADSETSEQQSNALEINGRRYTAEDIERLERERMMQEDYTRKTQSLSAEREKLEQLRQEYESKLAGFSQRRVNPEEELAIERDRRLLKSNYKVALEDDIQALEAKFDKKLEEKLQATREADMREKSQRELDRAIGELGKVYDGTDGRPKFESERVINYMLQKGIGGKSIETFKEDLEAAYKLLYHDQIIDWEVKNRARKPATQPAPLGGRVGEQMLEKKVTNLREAGDAALEHLRSLGLE